MMSLALLTAFLSPKGHFLVDYHHFNDDTGRIDSRGFEFELTRRPELV